MFHSVHGAREIGISGPMFLPRVCRVSPITCLFEGVGYLGRVGYWGGRVSLVPCPIWVCRVMGGRDQGIGYPEVGIWGIEYPGGRVSRDRASGRSEVGCQEGVGNQG